MIELTLGLILIAQSGTSAPACQRISTSKSAQYISFVRVGTDPAADGKSYVTKVWLKIHNNTTCSILLITTDHNHPIGPEPFNKLKPGSIARVYYELYDSIKFPYGAPEPAYGDYIQQSILGPGDAVEFTVPISHFASGRGLAVPFAYSWDNGVTDYFARHHIYMVPETCRRKFAGGFVDSDCRLTGVAPVGRVPLRAAAGERLALDRRRVGRFTVIRYRPTWI